MSHQYSNIPAFELFDTCILTEKHIGKDLNEVVMYTMITYSISESGELVKDNHLKEGSADYYRSLLLVPDYEKYLVKTDEVVNDWDPIECRNIFLAGHNKTTYNALLSTYDEHRKRLDDIKESDFAQKIFQYFIQVQLEFENWFWQKNIDISSVIGLQNKISKIDQKKELITKTVIFINEEIKKLKVSHESGEITDICANAYEDFIPSIKKKKIISVAEYIRSIYPMINHNIKDWNQKKFKSSLYPKVSANSSKKNSQFLGIFFL